MQHPAPHEYKAPENGYAPSLPARPSSRMNSPTSHHVGEPMLEVDPHGAHTAVHGTDNSSAQFQVAFGRRDVTAPLASTPNLLTHHVSDNAQLQPDVHDGSQQELQPTSQAARVQSSNSSYTVNNNTPEPKLDQKSLNAWSYISKLPQAALSAFQPSPPIGPENTTQQNYGQLYNENQREKANGARIYELFQRERATNLQVQEKFEREKVKVGSLQRQNRALKEECDNVRKWAHELEVQNEEFRTQILITGSGREAIHDEEHYIRAFEELKYVIQLGMVKFSRAQANKPLPVKDHTEILKLISCLGQNGKKSAEFLESQVPFQRLYSNGRWRHSLIRHIVALFLLDQIFEPFVFGVSSELSETMKCLEADVVLREPSFSNVLLIHQAMGRGILRFAQNTLVSCRDAVALKLVGILRLLLPTTTESALASSVAKIIDNAIELKKAMSEEQALYRTFWIGSGAGFKDDFIEVADDEAAGKVLLCTSPGLVRMTKKDNRSTEVIVVKAAAILESALSLGK